jgi:glycosyltransferase involved in cell wall biosynthesis
MKLLLIRNTYQQNGGEDQLVRAEKNMFISGGHAVIEYRRDSNELLGVGILQQIRVGLEASWSPRSYGEVSRLIQKERPDLAIVYNFVPLISPSVVYACKREGVPVLLNTQNYRLICAAGTLSRDGRPCEECLDFGAGRAIRYGCYRKSPLASAALAAMQKLHRAAHTWTGAVDGLMAPTEFLRQKLISGGLRAEKIHLKPNFLHPDPGVSIGRRDFALFAGRLSQEKGLRTLLQAWQLIDRRIPLRIVGDGPLRRELESFAESAGLNNVRFLGLQSHEQVLELLKQARLAVFPTQCYEGFPLGLVEAFACATPLIASRLGAVRELIEDGRTGFLFPTGSPEHLAERVATLWNRIEELRAVGNRTRAEYLGKYTLEQNLLRFHEIAKKICGCTTERISPAKEAIPRGATQASPAGISTP